MKCRAEAARLGEGHVPGGEVAAADVADLALADQLLHRLPDLLPRRGPVDVVHLVQSRCDRSAAAAGSPRTRAGCGRRTAGGRSGRVPSAGTPSWPGRCRRGAPLRCSHRPTVSSAMPYPFFMSGDLRAAVDVGGVEEVDARIDGGVHDRETGRFVHGVAEVHGPEADPADQQTGAAQVPRTSSPRSCREHKCRRPFGEGMPYWGTRRITRH